MRGIHLKINKCIEIAGVVTSRLLYRDQYMREYYSERYNRDIQVYKLEN